MPRALLIHNPAAGQRRLDALLPRIVALLSHDGWQVEPAATNAPGDATRLAFTAARDGVERVLVLGGDGTVREAAVGLQGTEVPLGILPGGTVNVLSRALGLPPEPVETARRMSQLGARRFDVGVCGSTPFLMMASAGLDAEVMHGLDTRRKARFGQLGIFYDAVVRWWRYGYPEIRLCADGAPLTASLAVASNIPLYGGSFRIAPRARWNDGQLDLVLFRGRGRSATLGFALSLAMGRHLYRPDVEIRRVSELAFEGPGELRLQIDGDACSEQPPVRAAITSEPVWMLAPG